MLLLFFRNCCRVLWKLLSVDNHQNDHRPQQHQLMIWIFLLFLLSQQSGSYCRPAEKWNHRMQRRFMWKQMDSTMDGLVERVVSGARVMKGMIGEFMPPKQNNVMDYLPTETTRVRYIIRNPHTKETKVIKLRPSKKVVKIMAITPKPLLSSAEKQHKSPHNVLSSEKLRQMEKEQELIAEGKMPKKKEEYKPMYHSEKPNNAPYPASQSDEDIVSGSFSEFDGSWKPVAPSGFSTPKPLTMSSLHTGVIDELLPQPQKQVYQHESADNREQDPHKHNTYEVTEHTAEESVAQPYTHEYYTYRNVPLSSLTLRGARYSSNGEVAKNETLNEVEAQIKQESVHQPHIREYYAYRNLPVASLTLRGTSRHTSSSGQPNNESFKRVETTSSKHYVPDYGTQKGFIPSRTVYKTHKETSTVPSSTTTTTTTTTEEPNYPISFLRKYRERSESQYHTKSLPRHRQPEIELENSWQPSNISYSNDNRKHPVSYQQHISAIGTRSKSQKWPPELEETQNSASSYDIPVTTDSPSSLQAFTTLSPFSLSSSLRSSTNARKNMRLKSNPTITSPTLNSNSNPAESEHLHSHHSQHHQQYHTPRNVRHRGTIRYGDKLEPGDG